MQGRHGYGVRDEIRAGQRCVVSVSHGGAHERALVETSGGDADTVTPLVRRLWPAHRVTRADSCLDWDDPDAWEAVTSEALRVARSAGVSTSVAGDWLDQQRGRTLYVGGTSSAVRLRVYEKGLQMPEAEKPHWVRAEVQVRPQKAAKSLVARLEPAEVWGTARWSGRLAETLLGLPVASVSMSGWVPPDDQRARAALVAQYGSVLDRWSRDVGGWAQLAVVLEELTRGRADAGR